MHARCRNPKATQHKWYAHITICEDWYSFDKFYEDMGERPLGKTLDRKNTNGNYCKDNCKWSDQPEQIANRRNVTLVDYEGKQYPLATLARKLGLSTSTVQHRFKNLNMTPREALNLDK